MSRHRRAALPSGDVLEAEVCRWRVDFGDRDVRVLDDDDGNPVAEVQRVTWERGLVPPGTFVRLRDPEHPDEPVGERARRLEYLYGPADGEWRGVVRLERMEA